MSDAIIRAEAILRAACGDRVRTRFAMAPLTTFRIGGPAALFLELESESDLVAAGRAVVETDLPVIVVGKGSNILVSDAGFPGLVLRLGKGFRWAARAGQEISAGGSMPLPALAGIAARHGLSGIEFGVAIPATFGGAVRMNAGAHGREMATVLERVDVFVLREGEIVRIAAVDAGFAYRRSTLPEDAVVIGATVVLEPGEVGAIRELMDEAREWRRRTQPLAEPNCGSVFKNPEHAHAATLIEQAGLKGRSVGRASISRKHDNFIVAEPGAKAADVVTLIGQVRQLVREQTGILLEPEVHLVGEVDRAAL